jgi:preprotein translocase subunit SecF
VDVEVDVHDPQAGRPRPRRTEKNVMTTASVTVPSVTNRALDTGSLREKVVVRGLNFYYGEAKALKLGLDLQGGVHLVLKVQTEDALKFESEREMERLREELQRQGITPTEIKLVDSSRFTIAGVPSEKDAEFRNALVETEVNFDRSSGTGGSYAFTLKPGIQASLREEAVTQARQTIERRVNELGVTEPTIAQQGTGVNYRFPSDFVEQHDAPAPGGQGFWIIIHRDE